MAAPPEGFEIDGPSASAGRAVPLGDARTAALSVYPELEITDWRRDPNSRLGRANPGSWHNRTGAAIDARPLAGMDFDEYVDGYRAAGYEILEARDEVNHPSGHATGPHWHVVLGGGPDEQDAGQINDGPPPGFAIDEPAARDPSRLHTALSELEAAFDAGESREDLIHRAQAYGVIEASPGWVGQLDTALRWRSGHGDELASVGTFAPGEVREVRPDGPAGAEPLAPTAELREHRPNVAERLGDAFGAAIEPLVGRYVANDAGANMRELLTDLTPVGAYDMAQNYEERRQRAAVEGRVVDAAADQTMSNVAALGMIPIVGRARTGAHAAAETIAEIERLARGAGAGRLADDDLAHLVRQRFAELPEGARNLLTTRAGNAPLSGAHIADLRLEAAPTPANRGGRVRSMLQRIRGARPLDEDRVAPPMAQSADSVLAPAQREVDNVDVADRSAPRPGTALESPIGRMAPPGDQPAAQDIADVARGIEPGDVTPIPANRIEDADELDRLNPPSVQPLAAPDERAELATRRIPLQSDATRTRARRGPMDLTTWIRSQPWGLRDDGGELAAMGIGNRPARDLDFARDEAFVGRLIDPDNGRELDDAAQAAFDAGYFPHLTEPPSRDDFLDALRMESVGSRRLFRPSDLGEVERFEGARAERHRLEEAAQEGHPLHDEVGEPVGPEDLDALEPPATAYEELPKLGGTVGNLNLANIENTFDIRRLLQTTETRFGGFDAARRGKITHAETQALASELGLTADDLLQRRRGQALNAEQALAARQLLAKSGDEVIGLAEHAAGSEASDETRAAFSAALIRHAAIHEQVSGATAEAGRTLSALRMAARSKDVSGRIHQAMIDGAGGPDRLEKVAERILDLQRRGVDQAGVARFAAEAMKPRFRDKLVELWYNRLLSGPQTHAVNILSNAMTAALQIPEQAVAAGIGAARRGVRTLAGKEDDFDRVMFTELGPRLVGMMQGAKEGLRAAGRTFMTGEVQDYVTKVESVSQRAIGGVAGSIIRTPTRLLASEDEFFKSVARRMELNALVVRQARKEGLRGESLRVRVSELAANPPPEMVERIMDYARYVTFQTPLKGLPQDLSRFTNRQPWMKIFMPFIRTPTNIFKFAAARSPLAPVLGEVRDALKAGGERQAVALSRIALGTGFGMLAASWAAEGLITGSGPKDRDQRDLLMADGWQPYSLRIGDAYYSYQRLDPLAITLGTAADLASSSANLRGEDSWRLGAEFIGSIVSNLSNKTWLSGATDVVGVLDDPQRNLEGFISRLAGSVAVSAGVAQVARTMDPLQREARTPLARIQSRLPVLSRSLPARRDVWGEEMPNEGGVGPDLVSPIWTRNARNDPINQELIRMEGRIGRPARSLSVAGERRRLTDAEYGRYQELSGQYIRSDLTEVMSASEWQEATVEERREMLAEIVRDARADARADLFASGDAGEPAAAAPPSGFVVDQPAALGR